MENKDLTKLRNWKIIFLKALRLAKTPIIISLFLTPIRFLLELAGLPENVIFIMGQANPAFH